MSRESNGPFKFSSHEGSITQVEFPSSYVHAGRIIDGQINQVISDSDIKPNVLVVDTLGQAKVFPYKELLKRSFCFSKGKDTLVQEIFNAAGQEGRIFIWHSRVANDGNHYSPHGVIEGEDDTDFWRKLHGHLKKELW